MKNKIYVGNLPTMVEESDLKDIFKEFGEVEEVKLMRDRETKNSRGFAFIKLSTEAEAKLAIEKMNGGTIEDKVIKVDFARERTNSRPTGGGGNRGGFRRDSNNSRGGSSSRNRY